MKFILLFCAALLALCTKECYCQDYTSEDAAIEYITNVSNADTEVSTRFWFTSWTALRNISAANDAAVDVVRKERNDFYTEEYSETIKYVWENFENVTLKRLFWRYATTLWDSILDQTDEDILYEARRAMYNNYNFATVCSYQNRSDCTLGVGDVASVLSSSEDPEEMKYYWEAWSNTGGNIKENFTTYIEYRNKASVANGHASGAEAYIAEYTDIDLDYDAEADWLSLWDNVRPLYMQLHAYVRRILREQYGSDIVSLDGPIPAHLLGNIWAQNWEKMENFGLPLEETDSIDITQALIDQGYTVLKMVQLAEEFFVSMNMSAMPDVFYETSEFLAPTDGTTADCQPAAWEFYDGKTFRITMCAQVTETDFNSIHHEMGHIENFIAYKDQPIQFHAGANPGFLEAIGDTIQLSVGTRKHLNTIGLLSDGTITTNSLINNLYSRALERVAFIPFGFLLDTFRYAVYRGQTTPDNYNCHYNYVREMLQGVSPPVPRDETQLDAATKFHVAADVDYARYYVARYIQFQFFEALCKEAGEYDPTNSSTILANCDIYNSVAAGNKLNNMLALGISKPWPDAMEIMTGQREHLADGLNNFFKPLYDYLVQVNEQNGEYIGWKHGDVPFCSDAQYDDMEASGMKTYFDRFYGEGHVNDLDDKPTYA